MGFPSVKRNGNKKTSIPSNMEIEASLNLLSLIKRTPKIAGEILIDAEIANEKKAKYLFPFRFLINLWRATMITAHTVGITYLNIIIDTQ